MLHILTTIYPKSGNAFYKRGLNFWEITSEVEWLLSEDITEQSVEFKDDNVIVYCMYGKRWQPNTLPSMLLVAEIDENDRHLEPRFVSVVGYDPEGFAILAFEMGGIMPQEETLFSFKLSEAESYKY